MAGVEVGTAYVTVLPSTKGFHRALADDVNDASRKAGQSGGRAAGGAFTAGFGKAAAATGGIMAGLFSAQAIISAAGASITAASDLAESQSKVTVVFGESAAAINDWAETSSTSLLMSKQSALEAAGTYGNLFQAFGIGQKQAMEMSTSLVQLAADLASFNNTSVDDALLALRSGLSGETEPLKRYGVALTDARLKSEAMSAGIWDGVGAMTAGQKAQASYALILKDTTLAQGDVNRTADGYANTMRAVNAELDNAKATIGTELLSSIQSVTTEMGGPKGLVSLIENGADKTATWVAGLGLVAEKVAYINGLLPDLGGDSFLKTLFVDANPFMAPTNALVALGEQKQATEEAAAAQEQLSINARNTGGAMWRYQQDAWSAAQATRDITDRTVEAVTGIGTLQAALDKFQGRSNLRASGIAIREDWRALDTMGERVWRGKGKDRKQVQLDFAPTISGGRFGTDASGDQARAWADRIAQDYLARAGLLSAAGKSEAANSLVERGQARLARQFRGWGVVNPGNYAESFLPSMTGAAASDEARRLGTTTIYQFGDIRVDSSEALTEVQKQAQRLAKLSGSRYAGMASTGRGYR